MRMPRTTRSAGLVALLALAPAVCAQGNGPGRKEAVQAALNKQAIVAGERQGALFLRDLAKHCGVEGEPLGQLILAMNQAIAAWVEAHPPEVWGNYEIDFRAVLALPTWRDAFERHASSAAKAAWNALDSGRRQRLAAATAAYVRTLVSCELRLTPEQATRLEPFCQRVAEQHLDFKVRARLCQLVREMDRGEPRVLSASQHDYPELLTARGGRRDPWLEFELESDRIRLLCQLDADRAHLLRAAGHAQGRRLLAEQQARQQEEARQKAADKAADKAAAEGEAVARPRRPDNTLPDETWLADAFWVKVRDSVLTADEKKALAANPPVDRNAVREARAALAVATLESLFHLDGEQCKALLPLAQKAADLDLKSTRIATLDVARSFGLYAGQSDATPDERGHKKALEDLLDRTQFEVLKDKVGI